jgi:hypothetical protein
VYHHVLAIWDEPSLEEKEKAMGFQTCIIGHTNVTRLERIALLERGMDLNSLTWLLITSALPGTQDVTLGLPSWLATLQALALVVSPRLGLRQNMNIHLKKCEFVVTSVIYLGHRILPNGIMAHWAKVVAILGMPNPIDVHILISFIALCNFYKKFVQDFSTIVHPLYALLKKDVAWTWSEEA